MDNEDNNDRKERDPYEAELYWNWQPGSTVITKWPDGWEEIPLDVDADESLDEEE